MRNVYEMTAIKHPLRKNRVAVSSTTATTIILMTALLAVVVVLPRPNHAFITPNQSTTQHSLVTIETRRIESSRIPFEIRGQASRLHAGKKGSGKKGKNKVDAGKGFGNNDKNKIDVEVEVDEKIEINNASEDIITINNNQEKTSFGDPLREANGIRASIHPTAINAIAESLKARAVMVTAGQFASNAIQKRQEASVDTNDGMKMNNREEECVAGRVMGVIMRLDDLENELVERTMDVDWVAKYDDWSSFGVLEDESKLILKNESENGKSEDDNDKDVMMKKVHEKIIDDPLFCMNRAECLLAIFIQEVEFPQFQKLNETAPDESKIDFLDTDRLQVVIPSSSISEE
ncbi:hypothetical protein FRACYDRAFT_235019 [Fragilariopsis cylindrus CCMP1102]|uniref:Uncharacterized protein n=1 Tax=Fragilariopsis cylindrus CCMP1102 TaxID=635003 RepID=A0A1E7FTH1_9STRA|nr:hypothetical protein FRACYDRAFT_235019 [Fragilariopsis cylindrus CCMP1102]|eukprot:OEU21395.1 hypothetical protein FRACYDRAFT_235019 [Fragilariopsis cylindrus CCMP1102]